jgi:hypothetical protein
MCKIRQGCWSRSSRHEFLIGDVAYIAPQDFPPKSNPLLPNFGHDLNLIALPIFDILGIGKCDLEQLRNLSALAEVHNFPDRNPIDFLFVDRL